MTATTTLSKHCTRSDINPDIFFPEGENAVGQLAAAKVICGACPFISTCLSDAIAEGTTDGVWGGVLLERGVTVEAKRSPGRPRKAEMTTAA